MANDVDTDLYKDVGALQADVSTLTTSVATIDTKLDTVLEYIAREKGAKRAWLTLGSIGGGVAGALFAAFVSWFKG